MTLFEKAISKIDEVNAQDPHSEDFEGKTFPKELLYSQRMSEKLQQFAPEAPDYLHIAARAQHIGRWRIPRSEYPMDRVGYLRWREELKKMHAAMTTQILAELGFDEEKIARVSHLIRKKQLKSDEETQLLEDVICLVFLEYYFEDFAAKHADEKIIDIVRKTWAKMSESGKNAALKLPLSSSSLQLIQQAVSD
ncbi:DUF4202 domain-containing protein [Algoriphagus vanfongensis]|uniref:DUF4202 domain-containing protein n=1 Tax=Algoriphagus vanfongensis TaxID=426371 RepID=UPI00041FD953|nr:DUF4202 domain-containing protein [Algoriphagus vanfongensis]